jgi:hypothetical protein
MVRIGPSFSARGPLGAIKPPSSTTALALGDRSQPFACEHIFTRTGRKPDEYAPSADGAAS